MFKYLRNVINSDNETFDSLIYVGAGKCAELQDIKTISVKSVHLVEAHPFLAEHLREETEEIENIHIYEYLVLPQESCEPSFNQANNPSFSSRLPLQSSYSQRWPNLRFNSITHKSPKYINELISDLCGDCSNNVLLFDVNGDEDALIHAISDIEERFSYVLVARSEGYNDATANKSIAEHLNSNGFKQAFFQNTTEGGLSSCEYWVRASSQNAKEIKAVCDGLISDKAELKNEIQKLNERLKAEQLDKLKIDTLYNDLAQKIEKVLIEKEQLTVTNADLKRRVDVAENAKSELTKKASLLEKTLTEKTQQIAVLESKLEENTKEIERCIDIAKNSMSSDAIGSVVEQITASHKSEIAELKKKLDWRLDKGFNNSVKQIESFIGVQSFLDTGEIGMDFHGWPISSDIALFLMGKIKTNRYDLIIEFGSGTSTQLFARAMQRFNQGDFEDIRPNERKLLGETDVISNSKNAISDIVHDLPQRVLTFEHNKHYFEKTQALLRQSNLDNIVNLVHAPLIDITVDDEHYLYYDCDKSLAAISDLYEGRTAKILVLVDGPPGATGPLARLPAMNKLMNILGTHKLDVVLDDSNRQEEKDTIKRWEAMLKARFANFEAENVPCEKGAYFCRVNP